MAAPPFTLTRARTLAFALPAAPLLALSLPPLVFLPPYFVQHLGVDLVAGAGVLLAARVLDIVIDPMLGGWQDRTTHRFGRRRLWMAAALPPLCALIWLVFIGFQPGVSAPMISLAMLVFYASFSAIMIAHLGWAGELAPDYHGRTHILGAVQLFSAAGQIAILVLPALAALNGADQAEQVHIMGWFLIVTLPLTTLVCMAATPERQAAPQAALSFNQALAAIGVNKALRGVLAADFLVGVSQGVLGGLFLFFVQHKLRFGELASPLLLLYFVGAFAGVPLWVWLSKRTSKHQALQAATLYTAATVLIIPLLPPGNIAIVAPMILIGGLGNGAPVLLLRSMMVDVIDEDHVNTGVQRAGLFFGLLLTTTKIGQALGPVCYSVLALFGFNAKEGASNSPQAMLALTALFAGLPFLLNAATAASLRRYPLDEARQHELRARLAREPAAPPAS